MQVLEPPRRLSKAEPQTAPKHTAVKDVEQSPLKKVESPKPNSKELYKELYHVLESIEPRQ